MNNGKPVDPAEIGGFEAKDRLFVFGIFGAAGLALGLLLPLLAQWAAQVPWMPFQGPLQLLGSFNNGWLTWVRPLAGLILGLLLALYTIHTSAVLSFSGDLIRVRKGSRETVIRRDQVDGVRRQGGTITILNATGRELFKDDVEGDRVEHRNIFIRHGYPWESDS